MLTSDVKRIVSTWTLGLHGDPLRRLRRFHQQLRAVLFLLDVRIVLQLFSCRHGGALEHAVDRAGRILLASTASLELLR